MKKLFYTLMLSMVGMSQMLAAHTDTDVSAIDNVVYIAPANGVVGKEATLSVQLKNATANTVVGYQFDLILPEGMTAVSAAATTEREEAGHTHTFESSVPEGCDMRVLCYSTQNYTYAGTSGEIANIKIAIDGNMDAGSYPVILRSEALSFVGSTPTFDYDIVSTITVTDEASYDNNYTLKFVPISISSTASKAQTSGIDVRLTTIKGIKSVKFDMYWEAGAELYQNRGVYQVFYSDYEPEDEDTNYPIVANDGYENGANISFTADDENLFTSSNVISMTIRSVKGAVDGVRTIKFENIVFTDVDGIAHNVAPYSGNVYVGNETPTAQPDANGTVVLAGDYSSADAYNMLTAALPAASTDIATVDLSGVTAVPSGQKITVNTEANPNAMILTPAESDIVTNTKNVVKGSVCADMELTDGMPFGLAKKITATNVTYTRASMDSNWGTLCLPYAVKSDATVQYYKLASSTVSGTTGEMVFESIDEVKAYQPVLFRRLSGSSVTIIAENAKIAITPAQIEATEGTVEAAGWKLVGTQKQITVTDPKAYYIKSGQFKKINENFILPAFRAYFEAPNSAASRYVINTDGEITAISEIESAEMENLSVTDLEGREVVNVVNGQVYLMGGKKVMFK